MLMTNKFLIPEKSKSSSGMQNVDFALDERNPDKKSVLKAKRIKSCSLSWAKMRG